MAFLAAFLTAFLALWTAFFASLAGGGESPSEGKVNHGGSREVVGLLGVRGHDDSWGVLRDRDMSPFLGSLLDQSILLLENFLHRILCSLQAQGTKLALAVVLLALLQLSTGLLHSSDSGGTGHFFQWADSASTATLPGSSEHFLHLLVGMLILV